MRKLLSTIFIFYISFQLFAQTGTGTYFDPYIIDISGGYCSSPGQFDNSTGTGVLFLNPYCWAGANDDNDVWFEFTTLSSRPVLIEVKGSGTGGGTLVRPLLQAGPDCSSFVEDSVGFARSMIFDFFAGYQIMFRVNGEHSNIGTFQVCIREVDFPYHDYQDCENAIVLDLSEPEHCVDQLFGRGLFDDGSSCLSNFGERASIWYVWEAGNDGNLTFDIIPYLNDDIDFILYEMPDADCDNLVEIRCEGSQCREPGTNRIITHTGLDMTSIDTVEGGGCEEGQDNYLKYVKQQKGNRYAIYINNFSTDNYFDENGACLILGGNAISEPFLLQVDGVKTCSLGCDGSAVASASGENEPFSYLWSNGATTQLITGLCGGITYSCTVTDSEGEERVDSVYLHLPVQITNTVVSDPICNSDRTGSIEVDVNNDASENDYFWSVFGGGGIVPGEKNQMNLFAGTYTIRVTDSQNCTDEKTFVLNDPPPIVLSLDSTVLPSCVGEQDGSIYLSQLDAVPPYSYSWSIITGGGIVQGDEDQLAVEAGVYTVTLTDNNDCQINRVIEVKNPDSIAIFPNVIHPLCPGDFNGAIDITVSGGAPGYTFYWSTINGNGLNLTAEDQILLSKGDYFLTVTDSKACKNTKGIRLEDPLPLSADDAYVHNANCLTQDDGIIELNISGGTGLYFYNWSTNDGNGLVDSVPDQLGLYPGNYFVTITDENNCVLNANFVIDVYLLNAGTGSNQLLCNLNTFVLDSALSGADPFGRWYDVLNSSDLLSAVLQLSEFDSGFYQYKYIIDENEYCSYSEALVVVQIEEDKTAGDDNALMICSEEAINLEDLLANHDEGGEWLDVQNTGKLNGTLFYPENLASGAYLFLYKMDQEVCPDDIANIIIYTDSIVPDISCPESIKLNSFEVSKYFTVESEILDPIYASDNCEFSVYNDFNEQNTLVGASIPNNTSIVWYVTDSAGNSAQCLFEVSFEYQIPNLLTPNGDGQNDTWNFTIGEDYTKAIVSVFNRLGQTVYISERGYPYPWTGDGLPDATYHYNIVQGDEVIHKGFITILR